MTYFCYLNNKVIYKIFFEIQVKINFFISIFFNLNFFNLQLLCYTSQTYCYFFMLNTKNKKL